jgi:hypothetical protein
MERCQLSDAEFITEITLSKTAQATGNQDLRLALHRPDQSLTSKYPHDGAHLIEQFRLIRLNRREVSRHGSFPSDGS